MWISSKYGFASISLADRWKKSDGGEPIYDVRTRNEEDARRIFKLIESHDKTIAELVHTPHGDYEWRVVTNRKGLRILVSESIDTIDYRNYKATMHGRRAAAHHAAWTAFLKLRDKAHSNPQGGESFFVDDHDDSPFEKHGSHHDASYGHRQKQDTLLELTDELKVDRVGPASGHAYRVVEAYEAPGMGKLVAIERIDDSHKLSRTLELRIDAWLGWKPAEEPVEWRRSAVSNVRYRIERQITGEGDGWFDLVLVSEYGAEWRVKREHWISMPIAEAPKAIATAVKS